MYKNRQHPTEVECRLFCCPILLGRCRFCSFLKLLSYRHTANGRRLFEALESEHFRKLAGAGRAGTAPDIKAFAQVDECSALGHRRAAAGSAILHRERVEPDPQCRNGQPRGRAVCPRADHHQRRERYRQCCESLAQRAFFRRANSQRQPALCLDGDRRLGVAHRPWSHAALCARKLSSAASARECVAPHSGSHLSLRCHFFAVYPRRCKTTHLSALRSG